MQIKSFPFIADKDARVLILGTIPGVQSLECNQYYGNNRNVFWKLLFTIFDTPFSTDYDTRMALILNHQLALWDVLQVCFRKGSLDSAIEQEIPNDLTTFLENHSEIDYIFFNGQKAAQLYKKYNPTSNTHNLYTLPSTSPANAGISFEKKLLEWSKIKIITTDFML